MMNKRLLCLIPLLCVTTTLINCSSQDDEFARLEVRGVAVNSDSEVVPNTLLSVTANNTNENGTQGFGVQVSTDAEGRFSAEITGAIDAELHTDFIEVLPVGPLNERDIERGARITVELSIPVGERQIYEAGQLTIVPYQ